MKPKKANTWTCPYVTGVISKTEFTTCGVTCDTSNAGTDHLRITHLATHNPSPAQWADAYEIIQDGRERAKKTAA